MSTTTVGYRLSAATGIHRGDRAYQQDQVTSAAEPAPGRRRHPHGSPDGATSAGSDRRAVDQGHLAGRRGHSLTIGLAGKTYELGVAANLSRDGTGRWKFCPPPR